MNHTSANSELQTLAEADMNARAAAELVSKLSAQLQCALQTADEGKNIAVKRQLTSKLYDAIFANMDAERAIYESLQRASITDDVDSAAKAARGAAIISLAAARFDNRVS